VVKGGREKPQQTDTQPGIVIPTLGTTLPSQHGEGRGKRIEIEASLSVRIRTWLWWL
jgi:hypothetical protein